MTLIKSISGIRGTIGGHTGDTLNPLDIVKFTTAYATFIGKTKKTNKIEEQKQIDRISELMGYSSSDVFGRMNQKEKINEGKSFNEMMDLSRHKNNAR